MNPVIILRCEFVCLVILVFLFFVSRTYHTDDKKGDFTKLMIYALLHVVFDIVTVLTVNNMDTVPAWLNWGCHILFYITAVLYSNKITNYVAVVCYPKDAKAFYIAGHIGLAVYILCLPFLRIRYEEVSGVWLSTGPAAIAGFALAFLLFFSALIMIMSNYRKLPASFKATVVPMMVLLIASEIAQIIWKVLLFTGGAITITTVAVFFSLENPVEVFKRKAMTDALTGVRSRSSYESDLEMYNAQFKKKPSQDYTFVFCDLNDLRSVNNRFGHSEGDNYISLIASSISRCMKSSTAVYRIGGDEFLVFYLKAAESDVKREIHDLQAACAKAAEGLQYTPGVAAGYARSSDAYSSLEDVVKTADYAMYRNKTELKKNLSGEMIVTGTKLNITGLTDHVFDAMCAANDKLFPFLTNMSTGVTRISPMWKEYFGLDSEFFGDFVSVWIERIRPEYREGYTADIMSLMNGRQKYHNFDYPARKADGEYVPVSCHGSLYQDAVNGTSYFTGFITVNI